MREAGGQVWWNVDENVEYVAERYTVLLKLHIQKKEHTAFVNEIKWAMG